MRKVAMWFLALGLVAAPAASALSGADDNKPANSDSSKTTDSSKAPTGDAAKSNTPPKESTPPTSAELASEIEQLRALILKQADQLDRQQREMEEMKAAMARQTAPPNAPAAGTANNSVAPVAAGTTATLAASAAEPAATPAASPQGGEVSPLQIHIGTATITPVGFMDFTMVDRTHTGGSGIGTNFSSIPYGNVFQDNLNEFRLSMQNSRIGFRVDADVWGAHVIGYMEADFLGNNPGNVGVSSNSNTLRSRLYWADIRKDKWEILGGQTWSLITPNRTGVSPLPGDLFYTQNMDVNYQLGLVWGRIPELRFVYHPSDKVALAFALESPEQYVGGSAGGPAPVCPAALAASICGAGGATNAQFNNGSTTLNSPNRFPDVIVKLAFDPSKRVHIELGGVERQFADFNVPTSTKFTNTGGGGFLNFNVEPFKGFRLIGNGFWSDGGGRYIFGQAPDVIIRANGSISPIHSGSTVDGFEYTHGKTMLFAYYGGLYISRNTAFDANGTTLIGYGFAGSASSQNRIVHEATGGFNQTFWKDGKYGALNLIGQYSYVSRDPWVVAAGAPANAHLNMVFLDLRYTLPGSAPTMGK